MEVFHNLGQHLNTQEIKFLLLYTGSALEDNVKSKIKDGNDFFSALLKSGSCDETNFGSVIHLLKCIRRYDLLHLVNERKRKYDFKDPVEDYLQESLSNSSRTLTQSNISIDATSANINSPSFVPPVSHARLYINGEPPPKKLRRSPRHQKKAIHTFTSYSTEPSGSKKKLTCDVRLRVRAEYADHRVALQGSMGSNKLDPIEQQLELFCQASAILRARDLGYIVCDIKFSELTYLDAFWRDYLNGSLLEALKGVFITERLKQAVGNESIRLLVNVDEKDYEKGRRILLQNLSSSF